MYRPRCGVNKPNIEDIKNEISVLKSEINASDEILGDDISYDKVVEILKKENASIKEFIEYEMKKQETLTSEVERISGYQDEEKSIITCCKNYIQNESFSKSEVIDEGTELFFKLEVLHRKICTLVKKFSHNYFLTVKESDSSDGIIGMENENSICKPSKKSLLDIIKLLLPELSTQKSDDENNDPAVLYIDDTMQGEHIEFLLSAGIIERCCDDPNYVKLSD